MSMPQDLTSLFPAVKEGVYLNSAAEGLFLSSHLEAMQRYASLKGQGSIGRPALGVLEDEARGLAASLLDVESRDIAFLASTSRGMDVALRSVDWKPGDNVVFGDGEFPTVAFAAGLLAARGVEQRVVAMQGEIITEADIVAAIDEHTRLVVVSLVSYKNGQRLDVHWITERAHERGALVFVDAVQALGTVQVSARGLDFLSAGTFKWLLGSHGVSIFYASPDLPGSLSAPYVGYRGVQELFPSGGPSTVALWPDARRFEEGMPNHLGICVLANALRFVLDVGVAEIEEHNLALVARTREGLGHLGIAVLGGAASATGSIVAFETERFAEIDRHLARLGTTVWAREGRVRISPHVYNTTEDIDTLLQQVGELNP
jgi:cysteine desulfurase/selenocysteine lyase